MDSPQVATPRDILSIFQNDLNGSKQVLVRTKGYILLDKITLGKIRLG